MMAIISFIWALTLGLSFAKEDLEKEKEDVLIAAFDEDVILGCCLLSKISTDTVKLRQMAVKNNLQGKGIGQAIMNFAETLAKNKGYKYIYIYMQEIPLLVFTNDAATK